MSVKAPAPMLTDGTFRQSLNGQQCWWKAAAVRFDLPAPGNGANKRRRLDDADISHFSMKPPVAGCPEHLDATREPCLPSISIAADSPDELPPPVQSIESPSMDEPNATETLAMIRTQYLEALYISRTSLAYFVKGPLSRARAQFQAGTNSSMAPEQLASFLQDSLPSFTLMDTKYRETIPALVCALPTPDLSDDQGDLASTKSVKKRKSSRVKPKKDGLYVQEEGYIKRWWSLGGIDLGFDSSVGTHDERIKRRIADLRVRESELQVLLALEILSLQPSSADATRGDGNHGAPGLESSEGQDRKDNTRKAKKQQDIALTLELLIDRLSIWQSLTSEGRVLTAVSSPDPPSSLQRDAQGVTAKKGLTKTGHGVEEGTDRLRDFCAEVIMPFFAARLPENCAAIARKVGGLAITSPRAPTRPSLSKAASTSKLAAPGEAIAKRTGPIKPRRTLERVLTVERKAQGPLRQQSQPHPPLVRSSTAPVAPRLKRETSETPLAAIPAMSVNRSGVLHSKRFSQREVDLGGNSNGGDVKAKKKASLDEELCNAITTLRKPNRTLAVKDFVDSSERRSSRMMNTNPRTTSKPTRGDGGVARRPVGNNMPTVHAHAVQVLATPKGNRKKNMDVGPACNPGGVIPSSASRGDSPGLEEKIPGSMRKDSGGGFLGESSRTKMHHPS